MKRYATGAHHFGSKQILISIAVIFAVATLVGILSILQFVNEKISVLQERLETHEWKIPSTIYAEAPVLTKGKQVTAEWLAKYLDRLKYQKVDRHFVKTAQYFRSENEILFRKPNDRFGVSVRFGRNGIEEIVNIDQEENLDQIDLEPVRISSIYGTDWQDRTLAKLEKIPHCLIQAVLAIEDRRFYEHPGIDLRGIARALRMNLLENTRLQGASTITQQLVKNFYLTPERSMERKINEAVMALLLERKLTKDEILELYLNEVYLGQRGAVSVHGVAEASRLYFRKDVKHLTVPESALIAGLIQAPGKHDPYKFPGKAKERRDIVLLAMKDMGAISELQYEMYAKSPLAVHPKDLNITKAPYFVDLVNRQLEQKHGANNLQNDDLHIFTTLDLEMQEAAEKALAEGLARIDKARMKKTKRKAQGCLIAVEPSTGYIRAYVGGRDFSGSQFDRISQSRRQPGSSFKPIVFATALENSSLLNYSPASLISDEPLAVATGTKIWAPRNYNGRHHGIVSLRTALAKSMNVATARLAQEVGLHSIASLSAEFGLQGVKPYPSLALGSFEATPWEMIQAYTVFANDGVQAQLSAIKEVRDVEGSPLEQNPVRAKRVLRSETAFLITDMLKSTMRFGTASSARRLGFTQIAAGKTGTTNDFKDAWFIGYTPDLICLVWVGYDDNTPILMNGGQAALPIWIAFMKNAPQNRAGKDFEKPTHVVLRLIDPRTGKLATEECGDPVTELFIEGTEPQETCSLSDHDLPAEYFTASEKRLREYQEFEVQPAVYTNEDIPTVEDTETNGDYIYFAAKPNPSRD